MKIFYKNRNYNKLLIFLLANTLLVSCGTYQNTTNNDGIYGDDTNRKENRKVIVVNSKDYNNYEENYFQKKLESLDRLKQNDIFTDIDNYNSTDTTYVDEVLIDKALNYNASEPWGFNDNNDVVVNINVNPDPFWLGNTPYFWGDPYFAYGFGFNNPWRWNRWGWNRWNRWGWSPYYPPYYASTIWGFGYFGNPYFGPVWNNRPYWNNRYYRNTRYGRRTAYNSTYNRRGIYNNNRTYNNNRRNSSVRRNNTIRRNTQVRSNTRNNNVRRSTTIRRSTRNTRSYTPRRSSSTRRNNNSSYRNRSNRSYRSNRSSSYNRSSRSSSYRSNRSTSRGSSSRRGRN